MRYPIAAAAVLAAATVATPFDAAQGDPRGSTPQLPVNWPGKLPEPDPASSVRNNPTVLPAKPDGAALKVPDGFVVEELISGLSRPRFMLNLSGSAFLVSESLGEGKGAVTLIKDGAKTRIIEGLDRPFGLAVHDTWLYVAETMSVKRYPFDAKAQKVTGEGQEIIPMKGFGTGHWTRTILFDRAGKKLYLTIGSGSNITLGEDPMRAALHRYNPDGTGHETVATGLRNTIGLRWYPGTDDLWAAVQERDGLGDDLVDDYLVKVKEGGFYGWPIAFTGPHREPRHEKVDEELVKKTLYPDVLLGAHVAVLDVLFYTGNQFPAKYRNGLFAAFHGSWNRSKRVGYNISFIPFTNRRPVSGPEPFLTGWMLDPDKREVWGRPVGLLQMADGSLLVTDDAAGKIWKVSYKK
jgi:glucose/arabinose dehydrogenase